MSRRTIAIFAAICVIGVAAPPVFAAKPPANWDGLALFPSKRFDAVYLMPGVDFRVYTKVMLDPTEVAFRKNWIRDYNNNAMTLDGRISDSEATKILNAARTGFEEVFTKAYTDAGYQVVTQPGADVLRLRTAVANLDISAPDQMTAARTRSYSEDAGSATVVLEARDSLSGALLGRAVDSRTAGDNGTYIRNRVTNRSDFENMFSSWARISVDGIKLLKEMSPVPATAP